MTLDMKGTSPGIYDVGQSGFNFRNDAAGTDPVGWTQADGSVGCPSGMLESYAGHNKVYYQNDRITASYGYNSLYHEPQSTVNYGFVQCWVNFSNLRPSYDAFYLRLYETAPATGAVTGIRAFQDNKWYIHTPTGWTDTGATQTHDTWYNICLLWNNSQTQLNMGDGEAVLASGECRLIIDGTKYGDWTCAQTNVNVGCINLLTEKNGGDTPYYVYWDAFGFSWDSSYSFDDNKDLALYPIDTDKVYSCLIKHKKEDFIRGKTQIHQDEGLYIGAEIEVSGIPYTSSQTTQNTWSYNFLVTDKNERYPPTYILESKLREIDSLHSKQLFTVQEVDYILEHICQSDLNHGSWGGVSQTLTNTITIQLGGDFDVKDILDDAIKLQGFTWYETPDQSGANTNVLWFQAAGTNASGVSIDQNQSHANCAVTGIKRAHDIYNRVEVEGSAGASGDDDDIASQTALASIRVFTERATLFNNQTLCNAMSTAILTKVIAPPKRIKIRGKWKATDYGMLQPGETVSFAWDSAAWDEVPTTACIIESFEMDLKTNIWTMILTTAQTYQMANDIQRKNSHLIEQNRTEIQQNATTMQTGITPPGVYTVESTAADTIIDIKNSTDDAVIRLYGKDDAYIQFWEDGVFKGGLYWNAGEATMRWNSEGTIQLMPSSDENDYLYFITAANIAQLLPVENKVHNLGSAALSYDHVYADDFDNTSPFQEFANPLADLKKIKGKNDTEIDYTSLPDFVRTHTRDPKKHVWGKKMVMNEETKEEEEKDYIVERAPKDVMEDTGWSVNRMAVFLYQTCQKLQEQNEQLEARITELEEIVSKSIRSVE